MSREGPADPWWEVLTELGLPKAAGPEEVARAIRELKRRAGLLRESPDGSLPSLDLTQYVSTRGAARLLGVDPDHVNHLLLIGRIRGRKLEDSNVWLVYRPSVEAYDQETRNRGAPRGPRPKMES